MLQRQPRLHLRPVPDVVGPLGAAAGGQPSGHIGTLVMDRALIGRAERRSGARGAEGGEQLARVEEAQLASDEQRRHTAPHNAVDVRPRPHAQTGAVAVAIAQGDQQRREAVKVAQLVHRRASLKEELSALQVAVLASHEEGRGAFPAPRPPDRVGVAALLDYGQAGVRSGSEQQLDALEVSILCRFPQRRRLAAGVQAIGARPCGEQQLDAASVAVAGGVGQSSAIKCRARSHEQLDAAKPAVGGCLGERRPAVVSALVNLGAGVQQNRHELRRAKVAREKERGVAVGVGEVDGCARAEDALQDVESAGHSVAGGGGDASLGYASLCLEDAHAFPHHGGLHHRGEEGRIATL
mmetsp:Transcript_33326/g.107610  ORF Transcript_33326/g.107610 Transcript_33326/m.107610 type:complete len:353 (+) Transcript_33326:67-1125(+)